MTPEDYILNSEYATLKNDTSGTLSVTLPNTLAIAAGGVATFTDTITLGVAGSSVRSRIMSTKDNNWLSMNSVLPYIYQSGATVSGTSQGYYVYVSANRVSPTEIRLLVTIPNNYGANMTISGLAQTITARVTTFLPPFV